MKTIFVLVGGFILLFVGCTPDPKSGKGFTLPDGDIERGKTTFVTLQCHACHTVDGLEFEKPQQTDETMVALGGETPRVQTYGDLVTSIINPSHRFALGYEDEEIKAEGESRMRTYNDEMTITQLIDLVSFLQQHYKVKTYQPTPYVPYY